MDSIIDSLKDMSDDEAKEYIKMLFEGYNDRKKDGKLFEDSSTIPKIIILTYYTCIKKPVFTNIYDNFKDKYISAKTEAKNFKERYLYNENKLEGVHSIEEQQGLRFVYDYIQTKENLEDINLYTLSEIHEILYSKVPYSDFGGKYRRDERFLPNTGIDLLSPSLIVHEMNLLKGEVDELVKEGIRLGNVSDPQKIIMYIDKCIELKCKLIKIHPFGDGNGRSVRAFINLLFRLANIPPIYIQNKEREKYGIAMNQALGDGDLTKIKQFYYYKICDSIMDLDIIFTYSDKDEKAKRK